MSTIDDFTIDEFWGSHEANPLGPTFDAEQWAHVAGMLSPTYSNTAAIYNAPPSQGSVTPAPSLIGSNSSGPVDNPTKGAFWKVIAREHQLRKIKKTTIIFYVGHMIGFRDVRIERTIFELAESQGFGIFEEKLLVEGAATVVKAKITSFRSGDLTKITSQIKDYYGLNGLQPDVLAAQLQELIGPSFGEYSPVIHVLNDSGTIHIAFGGAHFKMLSDIVLSRIALELDANLLTEADLSYDGNVVTDGGRAASQMQAAFIAIVALKKLNPYLTKKERDALQLSRSCNLDLAKGLTKIAHACGLIPLNSE